LADLIGCVETYRLCYRDAGEAAALLADAL
jgi:hypothetical protein